MTDEGAEALEEVAAAAETEAAVIEDDNAIELAPEEVGSEKERSGETSEVEPESGESAPGGESDDQAEAIKAAGPKRALPGARTVALAGAFAALLGTSGFLGWQVWQQHQIEAASEQAQRAAVSYAQVLTSIDSNKVDENFKQVLDGATGEFKEMYSQSSVELRQLLVENKATAHGVVVDSAVQEASKNRAVVLLFIDQSVSNTQLPDPRIDRSRMKMTLEKVDGSWRASNIELR